jgi:peroxiredoxin Q/BCP
MTHEQEISQLKEGELAPEFYFTDKNGKNSNLYELRGKKVVVYFYPKDFTPGCTTEASEFTKDYKKFQTEGIEVVGISPDTHTSHQKFREKMRIPYPLVSDIDNVVAKKYGVYGLKKFMAKEYMGVNRSTFVLDENGRILKIYSKVKPGSHSMEILRHFTGS